jgi:hypothetical protein
VVIADGQWLAADDMMTKVDFQEQFFDNWIQVWDVKEIQA